MEPAIITLIERKAGEELIELKRDNYVIDDNEIKERVNKHAKEIDKQLTMHWYKELKPFSQFDRDSSSINTAYIEITNTNETINKIQSPEINMQNYYADSIEGIGERIAELHRNIAILRRPGETRKNKRTGAITPYHPMPEDRRRIEEMERELQTLSRRQSERVSLRNELTRKRG